MSTRPQRSADRTVIQGSLSIDKRDYRHYNMIKPFLGVILEVFPADSQYNRGAHAREDRRSYFHQCKVLLVNTNSASQLIVSNVIITPDANTGLDDYYEHLPRGTSNLTDGEELNAALADIDPYTLDGDWCVVGFIGGNMDQPFIMRWWPHPKNYLDAGTSGEGNPNQSNQPQALEQQRRAFRRVNGIEWVVTQNGDIYLDTNFAGSTLKFDKDNFQPTEGRWPRQVDDEIGGSILVAVKPTQTLELTWDKPQEGTGVRGKQEAQLPQTNPRPTNRTQQGEELENTYIRVEKDRVNVKTVEELVLATDERIVVSSDNEATINATNLIQLEAGQIKLGENAQTTQGVPRGFDLYTWLSSLTVLTAMGPASINPADIATFQADVLSTKTVVE